MTDYLLRARTSLISPFSSGALLARISRPGSCARRSMCLVFTPRAVNACETKRLSLSTRFVVSPESGRPRAHTRKLEWRRDAGNKAAAWGR
jgi:hypothetical protein